MSAKQEKWRIILLTITSCLEIMTSRQILQNQLGLCNIRLFNFADIKNILTNMFKVIYFASCPLMLLKYSKIPSFVEKIKTSAKFEVPCAQV